MRIRTRLLYVFFLLVLIFLLDFIVNQKLSNKVIVNSSYLSNSEIIIRNSNMLHKYMIDMQGAYRGYLLTSQEVFLKPYYEGARSIPPLIREQKALLTNRKQLERLDSISILHDQWVKYSSALIIAKMDTLPNANLRYQDLFEKKVRTESGKKLNDGIRNLFTDFDEFEYSLRQSRRQILEESIYRTRNTSLIIAIISIACAIVGSILIIRQVSKRISQMVAFAEDISIGNFKQMNDQGKDELERLLTSLNQMSSTLNKNFVALNQKNQELDQFAYVVSHDLKAPLRGISNLISWIEEDHGHELSGEMLLNISLIKGRATRLENMINGLLEYARIGRTQKSVEEVDIGALLLELKETLGSPSTEINILSEMPVLLTEKLRLEQVFSNLISNAIKHNTTPNVVISISIKDIGEFYEFSIADNGPGILPEYHKKIFDIFQTLKERDAFESTGVGLAIVKKIVADQKGTINVRSFDKGSIFVFTWPKRLPNQFN